MLFVEYFYLDDHYTGDLTRTNTVFKAYLQAWIVLSLGVVPLAMLTWQRSQGVRRFFLGFLMLTCAVGFSGTLILEVPNRYSKFSKNFKNLIYRIETWVAADKTS